MWARPPWRAEAAGRGTPGAEAWPTRKMPGRQKSDEGQGATYSTRPPFPDNGCGEWDVRPDGRWR